MAHVPSLDAIEALLQTFSRALHPRELASRMELPPEEYVDLIAALDQIEEAGRLKVLPGGRVKAVEPPERTRKGAAQSPRSENPKHKELTGSLTMHPKGFGFVVGTGEDDIFVPPDAVFEALHGDQVRVQITGRSRKGFEGRIAGILKRRDPRVAGVLRVQRKGSWLEPDDSRLRGPIVLTDAAGAVDGNAAVVEIHTFPHFADELPEGRLLEVLGPQGDPQTEVRKILIRESVTEEHSADALRNAEQMATRLGGYRLGRRRDLRHVPLPTIDPEDARDHDDALWVERTKSGYRAYVAIADVSEYVRPESPLDEEARERGCTIYLPDRAIPMLPRALAGDLCSLLPEQDRFCLCVIADLDKHAAVKSFEIVEGLMRSQAKLTYGGVARTLGFDPESPQSPQAEAFKNDLAALAELSDRLRTNRMKRGALDLDLPEARVVIDDETGAPIEVKKRATRPGLKLAYSMVEEMMLLANELVAEFLTEKQAPSIYRVHGKPDEEKLERLGTITESLGLDIATDELSEPLGASKFLRSIQNHERRGVLEMLMLRSLKQAQYDTDNIGHFGLASPRYVHFTSPIRRYPDLRVHRQVKHILRGGAIDRSDQALEDMKAAAGESSKKERAAMDVEREVLDLYRTVYMKKHIGEIFEGRITGMSGTGLYLSVDDPCVDVLVPFEALGPDRYETDEQELGVVGMRSGEHIMLGDRIMVEIKDAVIQRRTVFGARVLAEDTEGQRNRAEQDARPFDESDIARERAPRPQLGALARDGKSRKVFPSTVTELNRKRGKTGRPSSSARSRSSEERGTGSSGKSRSDAGRAGAARSPSGGRSEASLRSRSRTESGSTSGATRSGKSYKTSRSEAGTSKKGTKKRR